MSRLFRRVLMWEFHVLRSANVLIPQIFMRIQLVLTHPILTTNRLFFVIVIIKIKVRISFTSLWVIVSHLNTGEGDDVDTGDVDGGDRFSGGFRIRHRADTCGKSVSSVNV